MAQTDKDRLRELLTMELLGILGTDESTELARWRSAPDYGAEFAQLREEIALIGLSAPAVEPPKSVKRTLLERVKSRLHSIRTVRDDEDWRAHQVPGIRFKELSRSDQRVTIVFELAPGTTFPKHVHQGEESTYIVEGSISDRNGETWYPGDFVVAPGGSQHGPLHSSDGCRVIITMSLDDYRSPTIQT